MGTDRVYDALISDATRAIEAGDCEHALTVLEAAASAHRDTSTIRLLLARCLVSLGRSGAEDHFRAAASLSPRSVGILMEFAEFMLRALRRREAESLLREALRLDPTHRPALLALARICTMESRHEEAAVFSRRALSLGRDAEGLLSLARKSKTMSPGEIEALYQEAIALEPGNVKALKVYAEFLADRGRIEDCREVLRKALSLAPQSQDLRALLATLSRAGSDTQAGAAPEARIRPSVWPRRAAAFEDLEALIRADLLKDRRPPAPILGPDVKVTTLGSCFAQHVSHRLREEGYPTYHKGVGEEINSTYANRHLIDWVADGPVTSFGRELEDIYGAEMRAEMRDNIAASGVFIFTLGVAPTYFDAETGEFVFSHGTNLDRKLLGSRYRFRTTSVGENVANLRHIIDRVRSLSRGIRFVITVSPVPLAATLEMPSAVEADAISKSVMRLTAHEIVHSGIPGIHYWPSFEIVRWCGAHLPSGHPRAYGHDDDNTRHVSVWLVDMIMRLFIEYFGKPAKAPRR